MVGEMVYCLVENLVCLKVLLMVATKVSNLVVQKDKKSVAQLEPQLVGL